MVKARPYIHIVSSSPVLIWLVFAISDGPTDGPTEHWPDEVLRVARTQLEIAAKLPIDMLQK